MARHKKAVTGLVNELAAHLDFAKDPNILVFTPLGGLGPIDIVTNSTVSILLMMLKLKILENKIIKLKMAIREKLKDLLSIVKQLWNKRN